MWDFVPDSPLTVRAYFVVHGAFPMTHNESGQHESQLKIAAVTNVSHL